MRQKGKTKTISGALSLLLIISIFSISIVKSSSTQEVKVFSSGTIQYQSVNPPPVGVFFEFGGENPILDSVWDGHFNNDGIMETSTIVSRTGAKSVYFYQKSFPKTTGKK